MSTLGSVVNPYSTISIKHETQTQTQINKHVEHERVYLYRWCHPFTIIYVTSQPSHDYINSLTDSKSSFSSPRGCKLFTPHTHPTLKKVVTHHERPEYLSSSYMNHIDLIDGFGDSLCMLASMSALLWYALNSSQLVFLFSLFCLTTIHTGETSAPSCSKTPTMLYTYCI